MWFSRLFRIILVTSIGISIISTLYQLNLIYSIAKIRRQQEANQVTNIMSNTQGVENKASKIRSSEKDSAFNVLNGIETEHSGINRKDILKGHVRGQRLSSGREMKLTRVTEALDASKTPDVIQVSTIPTEQNAVLSRDIKLPDGAVVKADETGKFEDTGDCDALMMEVPVTSHQYQSKGVKYVGQSTLHKTNNTVFDQIRCNRTSPVSFSLRNNIFQINLTAEQFVEHYEDYCSRYFRPPREDDKPYCPCVPPTLRKYWPTSLLK